MTRYTIRRLDMGGKLYWTASANMGQGGWMEVADPDAFTYHAIHEHLRVILQKCDVPFVIQKVEETPKPVFGLMPLHLSRELRLRDVSEAIQRYLDAKLPIPLAWIIEEQQLVQGVLDHLKSNSQC